MKPFNNKKGILSMLVLPWKLILLVFLVSNPRKSMMMMVQGQHEENECTPTDTEFVLEGITKDPTDPNGGHVASTKMNLIVACSCTNGLSFYKVGKNKKRGDKLTFNDNFSNVLFGIKGIEKNGWTLSTGGSLFRRNGELLWAWTVLKDKKKMLIITKLNFECKKEGTKCVAKLTYSGELEYSENDVVKMTIPFSSVPETQEDTLPGLAAENSFALSADTNSIENSGDSIVGILEWPSSPEAGSCGDPHFTTWGGKRFDFHGECDLVLASSQSFGEGLGLDVHIRTTMVSRAKHPYSYISEAAVRIGNEVLSVSRDGYWLNGVPHSFENDGTFAMSGYDIDISDSTTKKGKFMKKFSVDLKYGHSVTIKAANSHIDVSLNKMGGPEHFNDVVGLLGRHRDQAVVDRNGNLMMEAQENQIGQMWQVREWEDMLFPVAVGPQHPIKCKLPPVTQTARHLRSNVDTKTFQKAQGACSHVQHTSDRDNCIFDVLATGDIEMADFYDE